MYQAWIRDICSVPLSSAAALSIWGKIKPKFRFLNAQILCKFMGNLGNRVRHLRPQEEFALDFSDFPTSPREVSFSYKHRWAMNQLSYKMKEKFCPCLLSTFSLWQMKRDEGTAVQFIHWVQFKGTIQKLLFVMFQLYHLVGQNETHYFGYSASQSVSWGQSGCTALGQADPTCSRAYFVSHSGPRVCAPLSTTDAWWSVVIFVLEEQIFQEKIVCHLVFQ